MSFSSPITPYFQRSDYDASVFDALTEKPASELAIEDIAAQLAATAAEIAASESAAAEPAPCGASSYQYGPLGAFDFGSGALSNLELMLWVQKHSSFVNEQLKDLMSTADVRNKLSEDLGYLKAQINDSADGAMTEQARADAQALLDAYAGTPYEQDLARVLGPIIDNPDSAFGKDEAQRITDGMQSLIDGYGKDDQYAMINIQDLTSRIREMYNMASNMMSSAHQTYMAILGNVGR